jgi:hypothetical protein
MQHRSFYHSDRALSPAPALAAAQSRADVEVARLAIAHCYSRFQQGELPYEDYMTLADLIMRTDLFASARCS